MAKHAHWVTPPVQEAGADGELRRLPASRLDPAGRADVMGQRLRHGPEHQPDPRASAEQHGEPAEVPVLRPVAVIPQAHRPVSSPCQPSQEEQQEKHHQDVKPPEPAADPRHDGVRRFHQLPTEQEPVCNQKKGQGHRNQEHPVLPHPFHALPPSHGPLIPAAPSSSPPPGKAPGPPSSNRTRSRPP